MDSGRSGITQPRGRLTLSISRTDYASSTRVFMHSVPRTGKSRSAIYCRVLPILLALLLMNGCSTAGGLVQPHPAQLNPVELHVGDVVETATGNVISIDELIGKLSNLSIVYVGEMHTSEKTTRFSSRFSKNSLKGGDASNWQWRCSPPPRNQFWTAISWEK